MDRVLLSGIECYAHGGVTDAEQTIGQRYRLDIELELDLTRSAASDDVEDTIHYGLVHDLAVATLRERPFRLLESAAAHIVDRLLDRFPAERVTLRLAKLLPPIDGVVASAAVEIQRTAPRPLDGSPTQHRPASRPSRG